MFDRKTMLFLALGFEAAGLIIACLFLGNFLDQRYQWRGMGIAGGAFLGIGIWVTHIVFVLRSLEKREDSGNIPPE